MQQPPVHRANLCIDSEERTRAPQEVIEQLNRRHEQNAAILSRSEQTLTENYQYAQSCVIQLSEQVKTIQHQKTLVEAELRKAEEESKRVHEHLNSALATIKELEKRCNDLEARRMVAITHLQGQAPPSLREAFIPPPTHFEPVSAKTDNSAANAEELPKRMFDKLRSELSPSGFDAIIVVVRQLNTGASDLQKVIQDIKRILQREGKEKLTDEVCRVISRYPQDK